METNKTEYTFDENIHHAFLSTIPENIESFDVKFQYYKAKRTINNEVDNRTEITINMTTSVVWDGNKLELVKTNGEFLIYDKLISFSPASEKHDLDIKILLQLYGSLSEFIGKESNGKLKMPIPKHPPFFSENF